MGLDDFYKLFEEFVQTQQLDPQTAEWLLQRILKILFPDSENEKPKDG